MIRKHLILLGALLLSTLTYAQVSVNKLTGTANVVIPIYSLGRGSAMMPISLVYNGSGIKPKDVEGTAGMGWNVQAGGDITRVLHGLPDDVLQDSLGHARIGWAHNATGSGYINAFTPANTNNNNCTNEQSDVNYINSHFSYDHDTEPDIFMVNAPGLSCQLVYDNVSGVFRTIPYMDLKIENTYNTTPGQPLYYAITSFTITNDKGVKYEFSKPELMFQKALGTSGGTGTYYQNTYKQYQYGVKYYDKWYLVKMTDANGNGVLINYKDTVSTQRTGVDALTLYSGQASNALQPFSHFYIMQKTVTPPILTKISTISKDATNEYLQFTWLTNTSNPGAYTYGTNQTVVDSIKGVGRLFKLSYSNVDYTDTSHIYRRLFLRSFTDTGRTTPVNYQFGYLGETNAGYHYTTSLSDSTATHTDAWGYYSAAVTTLIPSLYVNPSNPAYPRYVIDASTSVGSDYSIILEKPGTTSPRRADTTSVTIASLSTIKQVQGGTTTINYQSADYRDVPSNTTVKGGGIRVKSLVNHDNITGVSDTTNYYYTDPTTGKSSGKPVSLPSYAFTTPDTRASSGVDLWHYSTIISENDLSSEDHSILYEYVKTTHSGMGSSMVRYALPAMNWDTVATPVCSGCSAEWHATKDLISRPTCVSYGPIKNLFSSYTFAPNPNYDFERGLILSNTNYVGNTTTKASETTYTYVRTGTPGTLPCFAFDLNSNGTLSATSYAKYGIYYGTSELTATETTRVYDTPTYAQAQQSSNTYTYAAAGHKLSKQQVRNSDQSLVTTNYKYIKDYTITSSNTNPLINALYQLQQRNINGPVESYSTVQRGSATVVTNAALTLFHSTPTLGGDSLYMPLQQLSLVQPDGLAIGSFSPFTINTGSHTTNYDSHYFVTANMDYYDFTGTLQTSDNGNKMAAGSYIDGNSNKTAVNITNAQAAQMAFQDFDSDLIPGFSVFATPALTTPVPGGHTGNYVQINNGQYINYDMQKNKQASAYIVSMWLKCGSGTSITFTLSASDSYSVTVNPNSGGIWKYYQWVLPINHLGFDVIVNTTFTTTGTIGMDDVLIYPQSAQVNTYAYDPLTHYQTAATNTNGISTYYTTDHWGRQLLQFDQDKNIMQRTTYVDPTTTPGYIRQEIITVAGITTEAQVDTLGLSRKVTSKTYYDGLGRSLQSVSQQSSPLQRDIIQPTAYDYTARPKAAWLPYAGLSTDTAGTYRSTAISSAQPAFYNQTSQYVIPIDGSPYQQQVTENSPLQRTIKAGMIGAGFQPTGAPLSGGGGTQHFKTIDYRANSSAGDGTILRWGPDGVKQSTGYNDTTLSVSVAVDEDAIKTLSYTDRAGRIILKRQVFSPTVNYDTYYVYNSGGMPAYVIPPKAISLMTASGNYSLAQTSIASLIFKFSYDGRGRLINKKVPGKGAMSIVYDPINRPVLVRDSNLAASNKWNYVKYDLKGRAISQGIYVDATHTSLSGMQSYVDGMAAAYDTLWYETRTTSSTNKYYSNNIFPTSSITALTYGYFDDYDLDQNGTPNYSYVSQSMPNEVGATTAPIQGLPTMTLKSTISNTASPVWLMNVQFYDKNMQPVQGQSNNLLNHISDVAVTDYSTTVPDFVGAATVTKVSKATSTTTTVLTTPVYDNQRRVTDIYQRYNNGAPVHLASYSYNELGQQTAKKLGVGSATANVTLSTGQSVPSTSAVTQAATSSIMLTPDFIANSGGVFNAYIAPAYQQMVDYRYNIRGQLLSINNSKLANNGTNQDDPNALFGIELLYNTTDSNLGNTPYYSGRISGVKWMSRNSSNSKGDERAYRYTYDNVGRYTAQNYLRRDSTATGAFSLTHGWDEGVSAYDENGNIQALHRNSSTQGGSYTNTTIDQLKYTYDSNNANQLYSITDTTGNIAGFGIQTGGNSGGHYTYDVNGNLLNDPYKNITNSYNILNKTDETDFAAVAGKSIKYIYTVDGAIAQKIANDGTTTTTTTYIGGFVYVNSILSYFPTPEGRVTNNNEVLTNEYILTDQQGNARISFNSSGGGHTAKVIQENSFYGFGMVMAGSTVGTPSPANRNLYNGGSEWQNQFSNDQPGYYETFFRNYDAAIGRFVGVDPEAEGAESMTSYNYSGNNPIMFNDPLGNNFDSWDQILAGIDHLLASEHGGTSYGPSQFEYFASNTDAFNFGANYVENNNAWGQTTLGSYTLAASYFNIVNKSGTVSTTSINNWVSVYTQYRDTNGNFTTVNGTSGNVMTQYYGKGLVFSNPGNANQGGLGEASPASAYTMRGNNVNYKTLYNEFLTGTGPEYSGFGPNHPMTKAMQSSYVVREARLHFLVNGSKPMIRWDAGFGIPGAGLSGTNMTAQFIGGARISIIPTQAGLAFMLDNTTDRNSYKAHLAESVPRSPGTITPQGTIYQRFMWVEPY